MAVHTKYGATTVLPLVHTRVQLLADGSAVACGEIETSAIDAIDYLIHMQFPVGTAVATGDTISIYTVESIDGINWTDGIDPANAPGQDNLVEDIRDARLAAVIDGFHTSAEPVTVESTFHIGSIYPTIPPYLGFIIRNDTSGIITSGVSATYVAITVSAS